MRFERLRQEGLLFGAAAMFLTRIPITVEFNKTDIRQSLRYFPLVGLVIGAVSAVVFGLASFVFEQPVSVLLGMIAGLLLTGALHEDGFADCCDALGAGWSKDEVLSIMKDSRLGTYGVLGLLCILGLKWGALLELAYSSVVFGMICAHSISRGLALSYLYDLDYVQEPTASKSGLIAAKLKKGELLVVMATAVTPPMIWLQLKIIPLLVILYLVRHGLKRYLIYRIGGYTGDALGFAQQVFETGFYLYLCILA